MLFRQDTDDHLYAAMMARDPAYDGFVYVCVTSTGIFCRMSCPARKPKRQNVVFHDTIAACLEAGFRPCKRCTPMTTPGDADPVVSRLLGALEGQPGRRWREQDVVAMGLDPSSVRRKFKRRFGLSFLEIARLRRIGQSADRLVAGGSVIEAQLDGGYESGSGFRDAITRLFGEAPAHLRKRDLLRADWIDTPIGPMLAIADTHALHLLEFADRPALPTEIRRLQTRTGAVITLGRTPPIDAIARELRAYFEGRSAMFSTRLARLGSDFQATVWDALRRIAPGTSRSYSELAAEIGQPSATRAVARANGSNQIAIVIPCHRVIGADGGLTGYGGGLWRKRWLLEHERRLATSRRTEKPEESR